MLLSSTKQDWLGNIRGDILAGLVVALALIPEAIAFSIIAGVDPKVGLYASFSIAVITAIVGGRPGMISAATGAMALVIATLVKDHGLQYLLAATILTGILQILAGYLKLGRLMSFISDAVMTGFVNALAIVIFLAQLPELNMFNWTPATFKIFGQMFPFEVPMPNAQTLPVYAMTALGLAIIYLFPLIPLIGKIIPSPLVTIVVLTSIYLGFELNINSVGDMGTLPDSLPFFLLPDIPLNFETLAIIFPYSLSLAVVGILESLMTANVVDDLTDTSSDRNRECKGQGIANFITGFFGGMAGCAMIGQSVINIKSGGRGRLSTLLAGIFLLIMVVFLGERISQIPMAALVAIMIMVSIGTFSWGSLLNIKKFPISTNIVMISTVVVVIFTHNLAIGVLVGVLLSALFFANRISHFLSVKVEKSEDGDSKTYFVSGQVFFNSTEKFLELFDFKEVLEKVTINVSDAHFWDISAVSSLDKVVVKFRREGAEVNVVGLSAASTTIVDRFGGLNTKGQLEEVGGH